MGYKEADRAGAGYPTLEVKRVALNDGLHASLILENGRISKLVSPSGEVAVLKWEGDQTFPRPSPASTSQLHLSRCACARAGARVQDSASLLATQAFAYYRYQAAASSVAMQQILNDCFKLQQISGSPDMLVGGGEGVGLDQGC